MFSADVGVTPSVQARQAYFTRSPLRAATALTVTQGCRLFATICALISSGQHFWPLARISTP